MDKKVTKWTQWIHFIFDNYNYSMTVKCGIDLHQEGRVFFVCLPVVEMAH